MNLTLISILGGTLFFLCFIIFKIVTSQSPFNINTNVNNNNKIFKNSFNTVNDNSINVKTVTNINVQYSKKTSYNDDNSWYSIIICFIAIATTISLYNKYQSYIDIFIIVSLCLYLIFLGFHTYIKFNTKKMLQSLLFSIALVSLLIYFYFYPLYIPENIEALYNANKITLSLIWDNMIAASFIFTNSFTIFASICMFYQELFSLFVKKTYCYKYIFHSKLYILFFIILFESGLLYKIVYFSQKLNNLFSFVQVSI